MDRTTLLAYRSQKYGAQTRGIEFHFTYEQWIAWWEGHLGPDWRLKRGRQRHQYVMARIGDKGHYEPSNVRCVSATENHKERGVSYHKLSGEEAVKIFHDERPRRIIAQEFNISRSTVCQIKNRKAWNHLLPTVT